MASLGPTATADRGHGTVAERRALTGFRFRGHAAHAGGTPMELRRDALAAAARLARAERVAVTDSLLQRIAPVAFDADLPALAHEAATAATGAPAPTLPSGPLHDAAAVAAAGIPVAMSFVRSLGGVSHTHAEDSRPDDLAAGVRALALLTRALAAR